MVIHQSRLLKDDLAVLENDKVRNTHHVVSLREGRPALRVDFQDDGAVRHLGGNLFYLRRSHSTWSAPLRPEIDEHRHARRPDNAVESFRICIDRLCNRREFRLTRTATPGICQMLGRHAVALSTSTTFSNHRFSLSQSLRESVADPPLNGRNFTNLLELRQALY